MSVNKFKEEFSQLLLQYAAFNNNMTPDVQKLLTHQEILNAVHETLRCTLNTGLRSISDADLKTPANEIIIITPNAPDITKVKYDPNDDQFPKSNTSDMDTSEIDATPVANNNKSMASDVSQQDRSSFGTTETALTDEQCKFRESLQSELSKLAECQRNSMYNTLDEARRDALSVLDKIEDIRDLLAPEMKPNRRLSSMLELPPPKKSLDGPSSNLRTNQRRSLQAARRSISSQQKRSDTSVTPTSRLSSIRAPPCSPSDGSGSGSAASASDKFRALEKKLDPRARSVSMSSLALLGRQSPCKPKNPKYAHVQSTIPKPTPAAKRKAA